MQLYWCCPYTELLPDSGNQYLDAGIDLKGHSDVEAIYVKSVISRDRGNPLIEALPMPLDPRGVQNTYCCWNIDYDPEAVSKMSTNQRLLCLTQIKDLRFSFPFHLRLESEMYRALTEAYKNRKIYPGIHKEDSCRGQADSEAAS